MSYTDCELPTFYNVREQKAKKTHRCCECSAPILVGEVYTLCVGKWDDFQIYKQHVLCANACRYIRDELSEGDCIAFGSLMEWYGEKYNMDKKCVGSAEIRSMMAKILRRERR